MKDDTAENHVLTTTTIHENKMSASKLNKQTPNTPDTPDTGRTGEINNTQPAKPTPSPEPETASYEVQYFRNYAENKPSRQYYNKIAAIINRNTRQAVVNAGIRGLATSYLDNDDSGTYDPKLRRRTPSPIKIHRAKKLKDNGEEEDELKRKFRVPKGYGFVITFNFTTEPALKYLRSITPGPKSPISNQNIIEENDSKSDYGESESPSKRRRARKIRKPVRYAENATRADGLTLESLPLTNPLRKGCRSCFLASYDDCSLINSELDYPCENCRDASVECELIIPPILKKKCEHCQRKRLTCSYSYDGGKDQVSCEHCANKGITCVAAPLDPNSSHGKRILSGAVVPKVKENRKHVLEISTDDETEDEREMENSKAEERMFTRCNQCRQASKRCSLKSKSDEGPCTSCRSINDVCQFVNRYPQPNRDRQMQLDNTPTANTREVLEKETRRLQKKDSRASKRNASSKELITLKTSFSHPIIFNHVPEDGEEEKEICQFCKIPFFGICGYDGNEGPRKVEGYWLSHGRGFREVTTFETTIEGGTEKPPEQLDQTRMCIDCTSTRITIYACRSHSLTSILGPKWDDTRAAKYKDDLAHFEAGDRSISNLIIATKFCSVCPNFAYVRCCTTVQNGTGVLVEEENGCGLYLCEGCAEVVTKCQNSGTWKGRETIDFLVLRLVENVWRYPLGIRADATLLTSSGELITRMKDGMGEVVDEAIIKAEEEELKLLKEKKKKGIEMEDANKEMTRMESEKHQRGQLHQQDQQDKKKQSTQPNKRKRGQNPLPGKTSSPKDNAPKSKHTTRDMKRKQAHTNSPISQPQSNSMALPTSSSHASLPIAPLKAPSSRFVTGHRRSHRRHNAVSDGKIDENMNENKNNSEKGTIGSLFGTVKERASGGVLEFNDAMPYTSPNSNTDTNTNVSSITDTNTNSTTKDFNTRPTFFDKGKSTYASDSRPSFESSLGLRELPAPLFCRADVKPSIFGPSSGPNNGNNRALERPSSSTWQMQLSNILNPDSDDKSSIKPLTSSYHSANTNVNTKTTLTAATNRTSNLAMILNPPCGPFPVLMKPPPPLPPPTDNNYSIWDRLMAQEDSSRQGNYSPQPQPQHSIWDQLMAQQDGSLKDENQPQPPTIKSEHTPTTAFKSIFAVNTPPKNQHTRGSGSSQTDIGLGIDFPMGIGLGGAMRETVAVAQGGGRHWSQDRKGKGKEKGSVSAAGTGATGAPPQQQPLGFFKGEVIDLMNDDDDEGDK